MSIGSVCDGGVVRKRRLTLLFDNLVNNLLAHSGLQAKQRALFAYSWSTQDFVSIGSSFFYIKYKRGLIIKYNQVPDSRSLEPAAP